MQKALAIGGASSGSGKTTFSIGLMNALIKRGIDVAPFKVGPDYIDPMFHRHVTKKKAYNLPVWMLDDMTTAYLFEKRMAAESFAIVEGVMGYYDGHKTDSFAGSTAHVAALLNIPAIIIFDASSMSLSAAAIVHGFSTFKANSMIKGVVLNNVASEMHYQMLKQGIEHFTEIKCYGYLKKDERVKLGSRHLGLLQAEEIDDLDEKVDYISEQIEATVNVDAIIEDFVYESPKPDYSVLYASEAVSQSSFDDASKETLTASAKQDTECSYRKKKAEIDLKLESMKKRIAAMDGLTVGIAMDKSFSFYYDENVETLKELGITLVPISPIKDSEIPDNCDGLYIGGGYPEVFAKELEMNASFRKALKTALGSGMPCYAECGGLMYLTACIDNGKNTYDAVGFFPAKSEMTNKLQRFGLINVTMKDFMSCTLTFRAHEFHKSLITDDEPIDKKYHIVKGSRSWTCGYQKEHTLGTYAHQHFYSNLDFLSLLIDLWGINKPINQ
ncbi:cobyrinate a,c-diamide synthase [Fusibacter paucivorans]|uniref:Cobyrinate a,c-diamide synthase n=1 Tax=Fusibacter paucivorans TaxID=76009 RepID=A0ABS5PQF7_9FIRM|nr:cobyrinate a,c-diamide synthase [Fusibacter paucivorans]MBS7527375.1 cobyrinate a,c-diamide synthase [Fusibacter paucivorans]